MKKIIILSLIISLFSCQTKTSNQNNFTIDSIKGGIIYEVNIRQYSKSGTFNEFTQDIPKIKELGVKILWLMPIHPISKKRRKMSAPSRNLFSGNISAFFGRRAILTYFK